MASIKVLAPAKVNLYLKILGKRRDSYHNILTLFERISLADTITISRIPKGIKISSATFITRARKDNLAYKAAELILKHAKVGCGVEIKIDKKIPLASGLGGGSSDAASVLAGVNRLLNLRLKDRTLAALARRIGSDVPFFVLNKPFALGESRGDRLKVMASKARFWHLIIYPGFGIKTKDIYEAFDSNRLPKGHPELLSKDLTMKPDDVKIRFPLRAARLEPLEEMLHNDLQSVLLSKNDSVGRILIRLAHILGKKAIVSGSGPSLFCLYKTRKEAVRAREELLRSVPVRERINWKVFIAETC